MNANAENISNADALIFIIDRNYAGDPSAARDCLGFLHNTQRAPFEQWRDALPTFPYCAFGSVCPRNSKGLRVLAATPIAVCNSVEAVIRFVQRFDDQARERVFGNVKNTIFTVHISEVATRQAIEAEIAKLHMNRGRR